MKVRINKIRLFSRLALIAVAVIVFISCGKDSRLIQEDVPISGQIKGIIVEGPWEVVVMQDEVNNSALLEYSESEQNRITAELLPSGYLHLKISSLGNMRNKVFRAKVYASWLEKIELSGAAIVCINDAWDMYEISPSIVMDISLSGASELSFGGFASTGGYTIELIRVGVINIKLSGASTVNALHSSSSIAYTKISGASKLWWSRCYCNNLDAEISGDSELSLRGNAKIMNHCAIDCSGASTFACYGDGDDIAGTINSCSFKGSGASHFKTLNLETDFLDVDLSGASNAEVNVNNAITGSLTGASTLKYRNVPDVSGVSADISSKIIRLK